MGLSVGSVQHSYAQGAGITVNNPKEQNETWLQYIEQGLQWLKQQMQYILQQMQHALQKMQYAAQLRNLLEVVAFLWTRAHDIYDTVNRLDNVHSIYQLVYGSTEALMNNAQSTADFLEDRCTAFDSFFGQDIAGWCHYPNPNKGIYAIPLLAHNTSKSTSGGGIVVSDPSHSSLFALPQNTPSLLYNITSNANVNAAAMNTLLAQAKDSAAQTSLNTSETQLNLQQQSDLQNEANNIDNIQNLQTTGNLQALQKQNQILGNIATQLMKLRALTIAKNAAEAQQREEETKDRAKAEAFYYQVFLTDSYAPMKKHVWK
ncbi:MAG: hypothetical protein J6P19_01795 [Acetobacter sp.]|nr:hypothetical protein [Acetobacter sp.]